MITRLKKLIHIVSAFLFPTSCVGCEKVGNIICDNCEQKIAFTLREEDDIYSLFNYKEELVRKLIWAFKYRGLAEAGDFFVPYLKDQLISIISDDLLMQSYLNTNKIILIPVPMSRRRRFQKKRNHIVHLTEAIANQNDNLDYQPKLVVKTRHTKTQVACKNRAERLINLKDAFMVADKKAVQNKICLIIDDIVTTGTTMTEIRKILLTAGARQVLGLAIARG